MALLAATWLAVALAPGCNANPYPLETGTILHLAARDRPKSIDPPLVEDEYSGMVAINVYEGLLAYHPFARPYALMPALAAAMPEISDDKKTYTFRLRDDVVFQDDPCFPDGKGRLMTSADVLYAFKRFAHPTTAAKGWWLMDAHILGLNDWRDGLRADIEAARARGEHPATLFGLERPTTGFETPDDHTFVIHLTDPYPQLLWVLAMTYTAVYPHEAVEYYGPDFRSHPVGTGPFQMTEFDPVYRAIYKRNPTFRDVRVPDPRHHEDERWEGWEQDEAAGLLVDAGKRIPMVDGVEMRFILEDQPRWLYFQAGFTDTQVPPKDNTGSAVVNGKVAPAFAERGVTVQPWVELGTVYLCFNLDDPTLANVDLRRAISVAIDQKWTVDNLYSGEAIIAWSMIPPGIAGFVQDDHPWTRDDGHADIPRAKELLAQAGYPGGIDPKTGRPLHLVYQNSGSDMTSRQFGERFKDELRRIGIDLDVISNTFPQLTEKMDKKEFQLAQLAWGFDYPDAQNILQLLYGPNEAPGINSANFRDPEFDALYAKAAILEDGPERTALYEQMTHIANDQMPWLPRAHRVRNGLVQPWLHGFKFTETHYQYWRYLSVDKPLRDRLVADWNRPNRIPLLIAAGAMALVVLVGRGKRAVA